MSWKELKADTFAFCYVSTLCSHVLVWTEDQTNEIIQSVSQNKWLLFDTRDLITVSHCHWWGGVWSLTTFTALTHLMVSGDSEHWCWPHSSGHPLLTQMTLTHTLPLQPSDHDWLQTQQMSRFLQSSPVTDQCLLQCSSVVITVMGQCLRSAGVWLLV